MPHHLSTFSSQISPSPAARHYHPTLSIWLSVDPMSDKYPGVSPYVYCGNNPIRISDPNGKEWWIDGFKYMPGQACPEEAAQNTKDKWNTMNKIYETRNGRKVIDEIHESDCLFTISSEKSKSDAAGAYNANTKTLFLNGNDTEIGVLSHEMFHAYQELNGRPEKSIFNEFEANLFSISIIMQSGNGTWLQQESSLVNGLPSGSDSYSLYYASIAKLTHTTSFPVSDFFEAVDGFKFYSLQNVTGHYNDYPLYSNVNHTPLIANFYPLNYNHYD